ncbi:MAG: right-handed parallel beta-helix repeat-containing protein, partial [Acidobacteria bacterium]|nr:right-handed parallel beta-helix repeat-containing protein [Acidobacteriota bacterium]
IEIEDSQNPVPTAKTPGIVAGFSSRGPSSDFELKPDLVAVGTAVYSAAQSYYPNGELYSSTRYASAQGTSFSAPMVAGAAAALKALKPALNPAGIKSILVNTANREAAIDAGATADLLAAGAGLLDMGRAATAGAVFTPSSLSFGVSSYDNRITLTKALTISNISGVSDEYALQVRQTIPGPSVQLSSSTTGTVLPGGSTSVDVTISADAPLTGGFQGFLSVTSQRTSAAYQVPYWAGIYVLDNQRILTVAEWGSGNGTYSSLPDALRAAQPGNVIEIADDASYAGGILISTNAQGLPLQGLTIRARNGRSPAIVAPSAAAPNIRIIGLRNVLIQGLHISGGESGIDLEQPAGSQTLSAAIDRCLVINTAASGNSAGGVTVGDGATAFVTRTTINAPGGLGILVSTGAHLTMADSTINSSGEDGIDAFSADVQILRSSVTNAGGAGAYLERCSGTIEGSAFSRCRGSLGDGIRIYDGALTVSNCTLESNEQAGIYLSAPSGGSGGSGRILHNRILANLFGLYFNPGREVHVEGNFIKGNGRGARLTSTTTATLVDNIIVGSTDGTNGDGIQLAAMAAATLVNNTVHGNSNRGVSLSDTASVSIANCIIAGNIGGDLGNVPGGSVTYSLIGDGSQTSGNNLSGDPRLTNPASDDYSLSAASPAVHAGSNSASSLPFLDYRGMLRVASAGAGPGGGNVDMGALESGSAYPLLFPLVANGDQPALGDNLTTGLAFLNAGDRDVTALFFAFDSGGALLAGTKNPSAGSFGQGTQVPILGWQLFGFDYESSRIGSALVSAADRLVGFFLVFDRGFARIADGVDVSDATATDLILMRHLSEPPAGTTYVIFNPGATPANVSATLYAPDGSVAGLPQSSVIQSKGQAIVTFSTAPPQAGYARVRSDRPVSALEFFGDTAQLSALRAAAPGTDARLYFPHFAVNGGFTTLIGIVNGAGRSAEVTLSAYSSSGQSLCAPVKRTLVSGGQLLEPVGDLFGIPAGPLTTGYIVGQSTRGGVTGFTSFVYESGPARSAAAVPAASVPAQELLFSHIAHQAPAGVGGTYQTGIALLNPFGFTVIYSMRVYGGDGSLRAEKTGLLGPGEKVAKMLSHAVPGAGFFTEPLPMSSGHVEVTAEPGLLGFELFFTEDFSQLASVPAQRR